MSRSIFLIDHSGELTELQEQPYDTEALLQRLLADYPGVLSGDSAGSDAARRWLLVRREIDVPDVLDGGGRWSVDHLVPTVVGQTAEAQRRKSTSPRAAARQWDEASFFEELERTSSPQVVWTARALLNRARQQGCRIWWGKGSLLGSFFPILDKDGVNHQLFAVWSSGYIEFQFQYLKAPFSNDIRRQELMDRLNAIPGVSIPLDARRRRPSVPLANLANEQAVNHLIAVFDWWLAETHAQA